MNNNIYIITSKLLATIRREDFYFILEEYRMRGEVPPEEKDGSSNKSSTSH